MRCEVAYNVGMYDKTGGCREGGLNKGLNGSDSGFSKIMLLYLGYGAFPASISKCSLDCEQGLRETYHGVFRYFWIYFVLMGLRRFQKWKKSKNVAFFLYRSPLRQQMEGAITLFGLWREPMGPSCGLCNFIDFCFNGPEPWCFECIAFVRNWQKWSSKNLGRNAQTLQERQYKSI